jgi:hypothetical protein
LNRNLRKVLRYEKVAFENGEKVLYLECLIKPQKPHVVSRELTLPSLNFDWQNSVTLTARFVLGQNHP